MEELRKQLFNLAVLHGLKRCSEVLDSLRDEVKAHGQFLVGEYDDKPNTPSPPIKVESSMDPEESLKTEEPVKKVRKSRVKKTIHEEPSLDPVLNSLREEVLALRPVIVGEHDDIVTTSTSSVKVESLIKPEETVKVEEHVVEQQPPKGNAKKRWQREQEALKRLELKSKGIFKEDVLTLENVSAWIKGGKSYAVIARESVGCTEEEVSKFCKKHNITSNNK